MAIKPNRLILSSSFGTLKNDTQSNHLTITVPSGQVRTSANLELARAVVSVGTRNSPIRARMRSSKFNTWRLGTTLLSLISTTNNFNPVPDETLLWCAVQRISATEVALILYLSGFGGGGFTVTTQEAITVEAVFSTYVQPVLS